MRRVLATLLLLLGLVLTGPAWAHAALLAADPADGQVLATAPSSLSLKFDEPVSPVVLKLIAPDGRALVLDRFSLDDATVSVAAPQDLANGTYALSWRVISADGHPVGGTTVFSIEAASTGGPPVEQEVVNWPVRIGIWTTKLLGYLGLFLGVGSVFFACWIGRSEVGLRPSRWLLAVGLLAWPPAIAFQGFDALGAPIGNVFTWDVWREGFASSFGLSVAIAGAAMVLALVASWWGRWSRVLSLIAFCGIGLSLTVTGHASSAEPQWLTRPAVLLHTLTVAFWAGSLLPLVLLLRQPAGDAVPALRRFSALIPFVLGVLLIAGVALAIVQLAEPQELLTTDYGRVFLAKMVLVALLLLLGALNRWRLSGAAEGNGPGAKRHLATTIAIETLLVVAVFAVVALWRFTPPPRALLEAAKQPAFVHIHTDKGMAELTITPGHAGPVDASIYVATADFGPLTAKAVTLDLANKAKGIESIERKAALGPDGFWHVSGLTLPVGGQWQVEIDILVSDFDEIDLSDTIGLRP
ncbi:MAG: copper resistance protein CopC [Devosia sp.]